MDAVGRGGLGPRRIDLTALARELDGESFGVSPTFVAYEVVYLILAHIDIFALS